MIPTKVPFGTKVSLVWLDSSSKHDWIQQLSDLPKAVTITSTGYVAGCTEQELIITNSICDNPTAVNDPLAIPFGCITELIATNTGGDNQSI